MRILYITHTSGKGGSSVALLNILKGIRKMNVEVGVICPTSQGFLVDELKAMGIKTFIPEKRYCGYYVYPQVKNPLRWCRNMVGLLWRSHIGRTYIKRIINEFKPDLVHTNSSACVVGWQVCRKMRIKHIYVI